MNLRTIGLAVLLLLAVAGLAFVAAQIPKSEYFAASAGGTLIQLASSRVSTPAEINQAMEEEALLVEAGLQQMTEPSGPPFPAGR